MGMIYAVVCPPAKSVVEGQRKEYLGEVDFAKARMQHSVYCSALLIVKKLNPDFLSLGYAGNKRYGFSTLSMAERLFFYMGF